MKYALLSLLVLVWAHGAHSEDCAEVAKSAALGFYSSFATVGEGEFNRATQSGNISKDKYGNVVYDILVETIDKNGTPYDGDKDYTVAIQAQNGICLPVMLADAEFFEEREKSSYDACLKRARSACQGNDVCAHVRCGYPH